MSSVCADAEIAMGPLAISHLQFAATMPASEDPVQQRRSTAHRASHHQPLVARVVGDQPHIPFVLGPWDISLMTIKNPHGPLFTDLRLAAHTQLAPAVEPDAMRRPPVGIGPSVNRITHHTEDAFINRQLPHDVSALWTVRGARQSTSLLPQPAVNLTSTLELGEFLED